MLRKTMVLALVALVSLITGATLTASADPQDQAKNYQIRALEERVTQLERLTDGLSLDDTDPNEPWLIFVGNIEAENLRARSDVAAGDDIDAHDDVFADVDGDGDGQLYGDCATTPIEGCSNFGG